MASKIADYEFIRPSGNTTIVDIMDDGGIYVWAVRRDGTFIETTTDMPCVEIEYVYEKEKTIYHTIREGRDAIEFLTFAWAHGRVITNIKEHEHK